MRRLPQRRSRVRIMFAALVAALVTWLFLWLAYFPSASPSWGHRVQQIESELNQRRQQQNMVVLKKDTVVEFFSTIDCRRDSLILSVSLLDNQGEEKNQRMEPSTRSAMKSLRVISTSGYAEFFYDDRYQFSTFAFDHCVSIFDHPRPNRLTLFATTPHLQTQQISSMQLLAMRTELLGAIPPSPVAKFRVVFSAESGEYFGYQTWANRLAFSQSQLGADAVWTRLLTCHEPDDISKLEEFPTFTSHRHAYAERYVPINKPDIIQKWFESKDAPLEPVILVIDPDSWLLRPVLDKYVSRVKPGFALGQQAYYTGSKTAQLMWRELCEFNCHVDMDLVGVPYVIHRDDLQRLAPLWKYYVLKIKLELEQGNSRFSNAYGKLDVNWASEMFGYNMAAAHLNIKHEIETQLQVRDVDGERTEEQCIDKVSLHAGRAWFPRDHPMAKPWIHTEGKSFRMYGDQVWCKCNFTASTVKPWPIPEVGMDFVSKHTLRLLHESEQVYGPIPRNEKFRRTLDMRRDYHWTHP